MTARVEPHETTSVVLLGGECNVTSVAELKKVFLAAVALGRDLVIDLGAVTEVDITTLQLLWAVERDASRAGISLASRVPEGVALVARQAGFPRFPGAATQE